MKKIINRKVYNTETATLLGDYHYSFTREWDYCYEALYQTKKGAYFIYGTGGPQSKYAEYNGNGSWCGTCEITVLSEKSAMEWAEENLSADDYCKIFGEIEEG